MGEHNCFKTDESECIKKKAKELPMEAIRLFWNR